MLIVEVFTSCSVSIIAAPSATSQTIPTAKVEGRRFYSPLVRNMAKQNGITLDVLDTIIGTGANGRVTKYDMQSFLDAPSTNNRNGKILVTDQATSQAILTSTPTKSLNGQNEIIEMDRMRRMISDHMVMSKQTSPHVTSFVEVDMTNVVSWRNKVKAQFQENYGEKITFTPIFIQAVAKAIHDYPMVNVSVDGYKIIKKNRINIGMATAMNSGNLIVPVIKNADQLSLLGLTKQVNDLAFRARNNKLKADEVQDGTFTVTNVGTFGNVMGTPIINQPQAAIMSVGIIQKKPAVIETDKGDFIGIKHLMFISLSYDHRVVDGMLGGSFLKRVSDYLEAFDTTQTI
jgi:2-oxoglutarate dehydrogenase E2 component (dihydrolipoamide succinyltransferase)